MIGKTLRVIPSRSGNYALRFLFIGQLKQCIERAALLVSCSELVIFELQPDVRAGNLRQGNRPHHGRLDYRTVDTLRRSAHIGKGQKVGRALIGA